MLCSSACLCLGLYIVSGVCNSVDARIRYGWLADVDEMKPGLFEIFEQGTVQPTDWRYGPTRLQNRRTQTQARLLSSGVSQISASFPYSRIRPPDGLAHNSRLWPAIEMAGPSRDVDGLSSR